MLGRGPESFVISTGAVYPIATPSRFLHCLRVPTVVAVPLDVPIGTVIDDQAECLHDRDPLFTEAFVSSNATTSGGGGTQRRVGARVLMSAVSSSLPVRRNAHAPLQGRQTLCPE